MATHSSILAGESAWTEEPDRLQSMRSQRVRHDWVTKINTVCIYICVCVCVYIYIYTYIYILSLYILSLYIPSIYILWGQNFWEWKIEVISRRMENTEGMLENNSKDPVGLGYWLCEQAYYRLKLHKWLSLIIVEI